MRTLVLMLSIGLFLGSSLTAKAATTAESAFVVVAVSNVYGATGHGEVQFKVFWDSTQSQYQALIWSHGSCAYRQWYVAQATGPFQAWTRRGGAQCVEWPPSYGGMNKSIQLVDVDQDGDLDAFQLMETSTGVWTLYLYKNVN